MEKILKYQQVLKQYLQEVATEWTRDPSDEEIEVICDTENNHFLLLRLGWQGSKYIHSVPLHFDIKNGKVWIQENWLEEEVGEALTARGIPKSDIVLGLQPPSHRPYTGYAVA